jgi:hypothetical protein
VSKGENEKNCVLSVNGRSVLSSRKDALKSNAARAYGGTIAILAKDTAQESSRSVNLLWVLDLGGQDMLL